MGVVKGTPTLNNKRANLGFVSPRRQTARPLHLTLARRQKPGWGERRTFSHLGRSIKSLPERGISLSACVCGAAVTPRAMHTRSTVGTPASVAAESRLRDADKTARVAGRAA